MQSQDIRIAVDEGLAVSGLWLRPPGATEAYVFAHGAGAGMSHAFMTHVAQALWRSGVATLRFNFPFMERGGTFGRTDAPPVAHASVRAALACARRLAPDLPLFAGGKSFGARMTTQAHALRALEDAAGLVSLGFPLHLAKKPAIARAKHLAAIDAPMLFVQGDRDALADLALMRDVCAGLASASLHVVAGADHGFDVLKRSGRKPDEAIDEIARVVSQWMRAQRR